MSDWPEINAPTLVVSPWTRENGATASTVSALSSAAWPSANLAMYMPFALARPTLIVKLFCVNGATASGNVDMAIYDWAGTRLVSIGSTAQSGTNAVQEFNITDTWLGPGKFYLAVAMDGTTGTLFRGQSTLQGNREAGWLQQASAFALPANATFAANTTNYQPAIGATTRSVV